MSRPRPHRSGRTVRPRRIAARLSDLPPLLVLAGATATGKTGLSLAVAERLANDQHLADAEIVSADSRQVYRGMDIGTAKVSAEDRARIPHHGLDLVDPPDPFTAADYRGHAIKALAGIGGRGNIAILAGGTGLYLRAMARGVPLDASGHDPMIRKVLEERLRHDGLPALVADLERSAPGVATRTDLANPRRVVRALERAAIGGDRPPPVPVGYPAPVLWLGLTLEPTVHRDRVAARARQQFDAGLVGEAAHLRDRWGSTPRAFSAIGYQEAFGVLDGTLTREAAILLDARRNWAYARRQRTWFRAEPDVTWFDAARDPLPAAWPLVEAWLRTAR